MTGDTCVVCQASFALVGRAHRCVPTINHAIAPTIGNGATLPSSSTYRYRNIEHRKAYMRTYMRQYRRKTALRRQAVRKPAREFRVVF